MLGRNIFVGIFTLVGGWLVVAGATKFGDMLDARHSLTGLMLFAIFGAFVCGSIYLIGRLVDARREPSRRELPHRPEGR